MEYLEMYPMTFTEFLLADNQENLVENNEKFEYEKEISFEQQ